MALVGGFLGAGKTTLIGKFSQWVESKSLKVGLVTNDQGTGLMDTDSARTLGAGGGVEEITGGCFCCRLDDLVGAVKRLDSSSRPDVIVAEPVGSCTDLMATVILPLEQIYQVPFQLSPLSVVLDARRALAALGGKRSKRDFHRDVGYVFRKQFEEAEWLVVNKIDLMAEDELMDLDERLHRDFPAKRVFRVSGKTGEGLEAWFEALISHQSAPSEIMDVDYARYATGEALLGWVNSEARCQASADFDWGEWLRRVGGEIVALLDEQDTEVGHFKMSLERGGRRWRFHQVMGDDEPVLIEEAGTFMEDADVRLLVNLRAEGIAEELEALVDQVFSGQYEVSINFLERAAFQPGEPKPTHRVKELVG